MSRGFKQPSQRYPRRGGHQFPMVDVPRINYFQDDISQDNWYHRQQQYELRRWGSYYPEQQYQQPTWDQDRNYDNGNIPQRGRHSFRRRPQRNFHEKRFNHDFSHRRSTIRCSKERGGSRKSLCLPSLIDLTPTEKRDSKEAQSTAPKKTEDGKEASTGSGKETDPPQVSQKTRPATISPLELSFVEPPGPSPDPRDKHSSTPCLPAKPKEETELVDLEAGFQTEDCNQQACSALAVAMTSLETLEDLRPTKKEEEIELVQLKSMQADEDHHNQTASVLTVEAPQEEPVASDTLVAFQPKDNEEPMLVPVISLSNSSSVVEPSAPLETIEALPSTSQREETKLAETPCSHEDHHHQTFDAVDTGSSALPCTPTDVHFVPVLMNRKETLRPCFWEADPSLPSTNINWECIGRGWAPEDYQEPPGCVEEAHLYGEVSKQDRHSMPFHSSPVSHASSDEKPDAGRVLDSSGSSSKSYHSSDSKHSCTNRASRELRLCRSRSPHRRDQRSRTPHRRDQRSRTPHRRGQRSRTPHRRDCCSLWDSQGSSGERDDDFQMSYYRNWHSKRYRSTSQERFRDKYYTSSYFTHKLYRCSSPKERSRSYSASHSYPPRHPTMPHETNTKKTKRKPTHSEKTKKVQKKRATSVKRTKSTKKGTRSKKTAVPHPPCAGVKSGSSAPSQTSRDFRSAVVLARTEEIELAYLQFSVNMAVMATMLLEKEPCMEGAMETALRANLRRVGDYYECMLKDFIDNFDSAEET